MNSDLTSIAFEKIHEHYHRGKYADFDVIHECLREDASKLTQYMKFAFSTIWSDLPCVIYVNRVDIQSGKLATHVESLDKLSLVKPGVSFDELIIGESLPDNICSMSLDEWKQLPGALYIDRSHPLHDRLTDKYRIRGFFNYETDEDTENEEF